MRAALKDFKHSFLVAKAHIQGKTPALGLLQHLLQQKCFCHSMMW